MVQRMDDHLFFLRLLVVLLLFALGIMLAMVYLPSIPIVGDLPGDVEVDLPGLSLYVPFTTSLLLSILLTIVVYLIKRVSKK
ncbi:MAG: DUF2905 domain-containing protein [Ignavibacteria bacterium]|nr:MAG: DUF2905 domain-containing protein [Ignavibacteria bacterium]